MLFAWISSSAHAAGIYWATDDLGISRAELDGTGVNNNFAFGFTQARGGIAANADFVYWTTVGGQCQPRPGADICPAIERVNADSTNLTLLIHSRPESVFAPNSVAVDETFIYWTEGGLIARANLDGTGMNRGFISAQPGDVAVDDAFIYWTTTNGIGRANLDGTGVNPIFISGILNPLGIAVDGASIYWTNWDGIGRANFDGTGVNQSFITGANGSYGIDAAGPFLYWTNNGSNSIGRANLDGTGVNQHFISNASPASRPFPLGIAVVPVPEPTTGLLMALGVLGFAMIRRGHALAESRGWSPS